MLDPTIVLNAPHVSTIPTLGILSSSLSTSAETIKSYLRGEMRHAREAGKEVAALPCIACTICSYLTEVIPSIIPSLDFHH